VKIPDRTKTIVFEGIDGVGKTTQLELTKNFLERSGHKIEVLRNLGGTPIGELLREVMLSPTSRPESTDLYISVAIQEALIQKVTELRQQNSVILMDRSPLSLAAYAMYGGNLSSDKVMPFVRDGMDRLKPDLTIILTGDTAAAVKRARKSSNSEDYFESKPIEYFNRVEAGYLKLSQIFESKLVDVDSGIDSTWEQVRILIKDLLS